MVLGRESDINLALLTDIFAHNLVFKCINKRMGTDLKLMIRTLSALKCNPVNKPFIIDCRDIAHGNCAILNCHGSRILFPRLVKLGGNLLVRHGDFLLFHLDALVLAKCHCRFYRNFRREDKSLALLHLNHLDGRS